MEVKKERMKGKKKLSKIQKRSPKFKEIKYTYIETFYFYRNIIFYETFDFYRNI